MSWILHISRKIVGARILVDHVSDASADFWRFGPKTPHKAPGNLKAITLLEQISRVAWQHIHFLGQYTFRSHAHPIDLEALLPGVSR
jgi:hypothetical protein